jgi:pyruvate/2-oxoglutarate dehydrogenase complex dihydrolipoamide dehydrogenase (E3) component
MTQMNDVIGIGAAPAGVAAAPRAADLGAATTLICRDEFGGMAANDGPVAVRTLAHAARLLREARQLNLQVNWNAHQAEGHLCRAEDDSAPYPD